MASLPDRHTRPGVAFKGSLQEMPSPLSIRAGLSDRADKEIATDARKEIADSDVGEVLVVISPPRESTVDGKAKQQPVSGDVNDSAEEYIYQFNKFLTFKKADMESEFASHFANLNLPRWRRTLSTMFIMLSVLYIYLIAKSTMDWESWNDNYRNKTLTTKALLMGDPSFAATKGWYM